MNQFGTIDIYLKHCESLNSFGFQARSYLTNELAVYDFTQSLIHSMPHKNKIALVNAGTQLVEVVASVALKNQQQVITKKDHENIISFIDGLDSSVHFIFWTHQHQFTSEIIYSDIVVAEILEACHRKKIYSIFVNFTSSTFLEKAQHKEHIQYSIFLNANSIFENNKVEVYFSDKLKLQLLVSIYQINHDLSKKIPEKLNKNNKVLTIQKSSALALKEYLALKDHEALALSELPFWITDKWPTWWPEMNEPLFIKKTLFLSEGYISSHPQYVQEFSVADEYISSRSHWKTI